MELDVGRLHARGTMPFGGATPFRAGHHGRLPDPPAGGPGDRARLDPRATADPGRGGLLGGPATSPAGGRDGLTDAALLDDALDCDLAFSPLTNTMPVLRHRLHREPGEVRLVMAWVLLGCCCPTWW